MYTTEAIRRFEELQRQAGSQLSADRFDTLIARGYAPEEIYAEDLRVASKPPPVPTYSPGELEGYQQFLSRTVEREEK